MDPPRTDAHDQKHYLPVTSLAHGYEAYIALHYSFYRDVEGVLRSANDTEYGLASGNVTMFIFIANF